MTRYFPALLPLGTVAVLAVAPWWAGRAELRLLMEGLAYLALAQMWNPLAGYTGLVSVGQQAFVGLGGYLFFAIAIFGGLPVIPAMLAAALIAGLVAFPTGWIAFRLNGACFAIGTWVIAEVFRLVSAQVGALGGGSGISLPALIARSLGDRRGMETAMYYMAFTLGVFSVLLVWLVLRSRWGLALTAIRDSELAAETLGVNTRRVKFLVYVGTAAFTALTGSFTFLQKLRITPEAAFSVNDWTAFVIFIVVIGGLGTIEGPVLGVVVFFALRQFAADWGTWYLMLMGGVAIAVMLIDKRGLYGWFRARTGFTVLPTGRSLKGAGVHHRTLTSRPPELFAGRVAPSEAKAEGRGAVSLRRQAKACDCDRARVDDTFIGCADRVRESDCKVVRPSLPLAGRRTMTLPSPLRGQKTNCVDRAGQKPHARAASRDPAESSSTDRTNACRSSPKCL